MRNGMIRTLAKGSYPAGVAASTIIQNHWSEIAVMSRPTAPVAGVDDGSVQVGCPHLTGTLLNWHDATTWPGSVLPVAGNDVTIPAGVRVLISSCSVDPNAVYGNITIPANSELVFNDIVPIGFRAKGFKVLGMLSVGSETCRLRNNITITLHGVRSAQALPADPSVKGIATQPGGQVNLHGVRYFPTWTRLAHTANVSDTIIFVQDLVNWEVGQNLVITTTELKDARDYNHNEVRSIVAVYKAPLYGPSVCAIYLNASLSFLHYGGPEYQAEVGLLSRRIMIQGDETNSEPAGYTTPASIICNDPGSSTTYPCETPTLLSGFGGHIQIIGNGSIGKASGIEFYRMGQTNVLGRYPFHFHQIGNATGSFIKDSSIHKSFFRCTSVHGSNFVLVSENVAYDAIGNCYYLEDGVEENNIFQYNLGAHIHFIGPAYLTSQGLFGDWWDQGGPWLNESSSQILPADVSASPFYITSSFNTFIGNAASGGWSGFSFPNLPNPVKLHMSETDFTPSARPLITFQGNTAHSTGYWFGSAGAIYVGGTLKSIDASGNLTYTFGRDGSRDTCLTEPLDSYGYCTPDSYSWMLFEDTKVFLVNGRGMQHWGDRAEVVRFESHDNGLAMNVFGAVYITEMLINCRSNHRPAFFSGCPVNSNYNNCDVRDYAFWQTFGGFQWYDTGQHHIVTDSIFRNCIATWNGPCIWGCQNVAPWTFLTHSDEFVPDFMQATRNITYNNVDPTNLFRFTTSRTAPGGVTVSGRMQNWRDLDGSASLALQRGRTNMGSDWAGNSWWRLNNNCEHREQLFICPMEDADDVVSFTLGHDPVLEAQIGISICINGNPAGTNPCPIVANATHFGRTIEEGIPIGVNAILTGPLIGSKEGGWYIRFVDGTPKTLRFEQMQVSPTTKLMVAIPYPSSTTFSITAHAATWCYGLCSYNFTAVSSLSAVLAGNGDVYFFDSDNGILFIRVVQQVDTPLGTGTNWILQTLQTFVRESITMLEGSSFYNFVITSSNCAGTSTKCAQGSDYIPSALYTTTTSAPSVPGTIQPTSPSKLDQNTSVIIGSVVGAAVFIILSGILFLHLRAKKIRKNHLLLKEATAQEIVPKAP